LCADDRASRVLVRGSGAVLRGLPRRTGGEQPDRRAAGELEPRGRKPALAPALPRGDDVLPDVGAVSDGGGSGRDARDPRRGHGRGASRFRARPAVAAPHSRPGSGRGATGSTVASPSRPTGAPRGSPGSPRGSTGVGGAPTGAIRGPT